MEIIFTFSVSTNRIGSEIKEDVALQFDEDVAEEEIEVSVQEIYKEWVWKNINSGYSRK